MLRLRLISLCCLLLLTSFARAASTLDNARRAAAMLGEDTWSRVIRVENVAPRSAYPATFHALVFEFGGLLWLYTDRLGTQSFSLHTHNLAVEKADFAPLLRAIDPGFTGFSFVGTERRRSAKRALGTIPNGCFIESVVALRERVARGEPIGRARLVSFYGASPVGPIAHTVLAYETPSGAFALDGQVSGSPRRIGNQLPKEARAVVEAVRPDVVVSLARWVPTSVGGDQSLLTAVAEGRPPATGRR